MLVKIFILIPVLYFLAILQVSFFPHFSIFGYAPNFMFIFIVLLIFAAPSLGLVSALWGGVLSDVFSANIFGFSVLIFFGITVFIQMILKKYVQISFR